MELGGNAPFLVFEDADLDKAVQGVIDAKFRNIGQACTAANRILVQDTIAEEFTKRVADRVRAFKMGRGTEEGVVIGPLAEAKAVDKVASLVDDAVERGAKVVVGGKKGEGEGYFYDATVLTDISPEADIFREEIFGPVLPIVTFSSEEEAVELANGTEFGLMSYVYTKDFDRSQRMIDQIECGMVSINTGLPSNAAAPFGGIKQSGVGKEGSFEGIHEYLTMKYSAMSNPYDN